jgi:hypothetical protein
MGAQIIHYCSRLLPLSTSAKFSRPQPCDWLITSLVVQYGRHIPPQPLQLVPHGRLRRIQNRPDLTGAFLGQNHCNYRPCPQPP